MSAAALSQVAATGVSSGPRLSVLKRASSGVVDATSECEAVPGTSPRHVRLRAAAPPPSLLDAIVNDDVAALDAHLRRDTTAAAATVRRSLVVHVDAR